MCQSRRRPPVQTPVIPAKNRSSSGETGHRFEARRARRRSNSSSSISPRAYCSRRAASAPSSVGLSTCEPANSRYSTAMESPTTSAGQSISEGGTVARVRTTSGGDRQRERSEDDERQRTGSASSKWILHGSSPCANRRGQPRTYSRTGKRSTSAAPPISYCSMYASSPRMRPAPNAATARNTSMYAKSPLMRPWAMSQFPK